MTNKIELSMCSHECVIMSEIDQRPFAEVNLKHGRSDVLNGCRTNPNTLSPATPRTFVDPRG